MQNRYSENIVARIEISVRIWQFYNVSKTQVRKSKYLTNCSRQRTRVVYEIQASHGGSFTSITLTSINDERMLRKIRAETHLERIPS